jgi:YVTN family beta-propeller protein
LLPLPKEEKLLVADAFGNRLAVLNAETGQLLSVHRIEGHNIRGLAVGPHGQSVLIAHQHIPHKAVASYDGVHWGRIVSNAVQAVELSKLLQPETDEPISGWLNLFGDIGSAMADPSNVITGENGLVAVAFSGVAELAVRYQGRSLRLPVQRGPQAMAVAEQTLYVANRLEDSLSVIDLTQGKVIREISLGPAPELSAEQRGEKLFFDARLSHDGWLSCHSCHTDGHTAGLVVDTQGDGDYGAPKLVPSLLGTRDTQPWGWDGNAALLREQVQKSLTTTMHGEPLSTRDLEDMFAFLTSLDSPPPPRLALQSLREIGRKVFESRGCVNCHAPPAYTTPITVNVGLLDEQGRNRFNPPSLRGASQRRRFFHDGRADSLEDVLNTVRHQLDEPLSQDDAKALLAFLRSI